MTEPIPFVTKAERERQRLIEQARRNYDSIFGPGRFEEPREKGDKE